MWIDGNHTYEFAKDDCERYWPLVKPGGILCGHDYCNVPPTCEVKRAVDEFMPFGLVTFPNVSSCWLIRK